MHNRYIIIMKVLKLILLVLLIFVLLLLLIPVNKLPANTRQFLHLITRNCHYWEPNDPDPYRKCYEPSFNAQ
jgi:hypothetical protein